MRITLACTLLVSSLEVACGGAVPSPDIRTPPEHAYEVVPYPPPSALVEIVPASPRAEAKWVDGYWVWRGRYYVWERGGWVLPPEGARSSRWDARYLSDGTLLYAPTQWYDADDKPIEAPQFLLPAATPPTPRTAEPTTIP